MNVVLGAAIAVALWTWSLIVADASDKKKSAKPIARGVHPDARAIANHASPHCRDTRRFDLTYRRCSR